MGGTGLGFKVLRTCKLVETLMWFDETEAEEGTHNPETQCLINVADATAPQHFVVKLENGF